ncbi:MAG: helix-turn-helix transcriptional regulator [Gammaproteobacteria bacterium]|nr:helix-turn-helix transcriptional regulator [Gammaproteobacteria bacterium]
MNTNFAKAFRVIRAAYGLQQSELAERIGISASQLCLIEKGKRQPSLRVVVSLGSAIGVPTSLITLLASDPEDVANQDISELAKALLLLLVKAQETEQTTLRLNG